MQLVIFFVPEPARGVAEMARAVRPGGLVTAYAWDLPGGGLPYEALQAEMRALGVAVPAPPNPDASGLDSLRELWTGAGLVDVATHVITVQRGFADIDDYWATVLGGASVGRSLAAMTPGDLALLKTRMLAQLRPDAEGRITCTGRAHAIKASVPG